tara:strand:- start:586 stop:864 length:279 start_codon:yes stop_codon:yes gene_type:complete
MIEKEFEVSIREAKKRLSSTLQHKLRVVMKCYTVINFTLNENDRTFSFNKTNRIRGIVIKDSKTYAGSYVVNENENSSYDKEYVLKVNVGRV